MRIVADENIPGLAQLLGPDVDLHQVQGRSLDAEVLMDADALLVRSVTPVDQALLQETPIRFVGTATSGYDHIDTQYLDSAGIRFAYAPGANANSVVEYVLAAIAAVDDFLERILAGGRVGIVGYGHVGKLLAARLKALRVAYCVYDPWLEQGAILHSAELQTVLDCDVVTLHPQLTDEAPFPSRYLLGTAELNTMGGHQLLINASRGPVIDNAALEQRLQAATPPTVVLDVWEDEPRVPEDLLSLVRLGTAHIAGYSRNSKLRGTAMLISALSNSEPALSFCTTGSESGLLTLNQELDGVSLMRALLLAHCPILGDDALLRHAVTVNDPDIAFDRLRRDYAPRYEVAGQLIPDALSSDQVAMLVALGCCNTPGSDG